MSDDPAAKARALAALFSQKLAPTTASAEHDPSASSHAENASADGAPAAAPAATSSVLGKRTSREEYAVSNDVGGGKRTKIIVPLSKFPDVDFLDLLNQSYIRDLEIETNARITLRGKGVPNDDEADSDEMYVLIQAESESALEKAANRISELVNDPEAKNKQLSTVGQQFVSPLAKDPVAQPTGTFALSSALYANDDGFTMMSSAPRSGPYNSAPAYGAGASAPYQQPSREGEETKDIRVPQDKIGLVIGRGGETIKTIQSSTGVYLQVQKSEPVDGMRIITLKGTPYQIEAGEIEVNRVLTSARESAGGAGGAPGAYGGPGGAPRFGGPGLGYGGGGGGGGEIMQVPQAVIGLVIGARGSTIRGLEERTGAMIKVQKEESSQPGMRDIRLTGAPHAIAAARQAIEELANNSRDNLGGRGPPGAPGMGGGPSGGHGGPSSTTAIPVPTQTTGTIIGRGGEIIKRLQQVSGCRIQLSSDESPAGPDMRDVIVTGRPDQIETAKREIDKIVATKMSGGNVDIRMIGAGGGAAPAYGGGGYNSGYGAPAAGGYGGQGGYGGGYGGPQRGGPSYGHNPYGPPGGSSGYGAPAGYGAAPGGYGAPHQGYGDHSAPAAVPAAAPAAPAEEEAPVPPQDPQEFQTWWGTLSLPQQTAYYRKYYPEMLSQLQHEPPYFYLL